MMKQDGASKGMAFHALEKDSCAAASAVVEQARDPMNMAFRPLVKDRCVMESAVLEQPRAPMNTAPH